MSEDVKGYEAAEGEVVISAANRVLRYNSTSQSGDYGILCVTNYRIVFVSAESTELPPITPRQDSQSHVIALASVRKLFGTARESSSSSVFSGRTKIALGPNMKSTNLAFIEIACKDFHVHRFGVLFSDQNSVRKLINTLIHHCFPENQSCLFAFDFRPSFANGDGGSLAVNLRETREQTLRAEMERCGISGTSEWTIQQNLQFEFCESYPALIAIPSVVTDEMFYGAKAGWQNGRFPIWCWSEPNVTKNKTWLARSSKLLGEPEDTNDMHIAFVSWSETQTTTVDATSYTAAKLQTCYDKLLDICYFERGASEQDKYLEKDSWMVLYDESKWPRQIQSALHISVSAVQDMLSRHNIIVEGHAPSHSESLVISLMEMMLDPFYRTMRGFQTLIEKEWCAAGFRFLDSHIQQSGSKGQNSIFLLFLDCVHQMVQQFPLSFEFTEIFLVHLWTSVTSCLCGDFIYNSDRDRSTPAFAKTNSFWAHAKHCSPESPEEDVHINPAYRPKKGVLIVGCTGVHIRPWVACFFPVLANEFQKQQTKTRIQILKKTETRNLLLEKHRQLKAELAAKATSN
eukprot:m.131884 g.131884  ORF g.131884 m.131884 type:complete len:572 (-) comp29574_c2_seq1:250-1965(-)